MEFFQDIFKPIWYIWVMFIVVGIASLFAPKIKGFMGEKSVKFFLSGLNPKKYKVINNIILQIDGRTTQIDHIVVSNYGVFVIETKNYTGWITGKEFDDSWTQTLNKNSKNSFNNPIKQNYGHIQALKEVLSEIIDVKYISIVAFTMKAELKVITNTDVVYTAKLPKTIKKYCIETLSDSSKQQIYEKLISLNISSKENSKAHVQAIKNNLADKENKIRSNICPKCGGGLVKRNGRYGIFMGCDNYPKCRFILK